MAEAEPNLEARQEFWKPVVASPVEDAEVPAMPLACSNCGTDFLIGSRFCYMCGNDRQAVGDVVAPRRIPAWLDFASLPGALGQSVASLVALSLGCACIVAAIVTSFRFTATTLLDWQAIQLWRIEWLLAAIAIFAAGILLKKKK